MKVSDKLILRKLYPGEYPLDRRVGGPETLPVDAMEKIKISCACRA
jgi:hypothetical protein